MRIEGKCHCGNISYRFDIPGAAKDLSVRVCDCSFCVKHGGAWTSHREGKLAVAIGDAARLSLYRFGTRTAEFYVCSTCGAVPLVTSEIQSQLYAVVNVNTFDGVDPASLARQPVTFEGEKSESRLARREQRWIPHVSIKK